jgi:two-component system, cell cycle sensor histidine kinase and response regulator CckA
VENRPGGPRVLNVGDDEGVRTRSLIEQGFDVVEARSGEEALRLAESGPDLIVLDLRLADHDGTEVLTRLKVDHRTSSIPVLDLSDVPVPIDGPLLAASIRALLRAREAEAEPWRAARDWQASFERISQGVAPAGPDSRIEQERARLEAVLQQMPAGVLISEASGALIFKNRLMEKLLPDTERRLTQKSFRPDGTPYRASEMPSSRALASGEVVTNEEIHISAADGSRRVLLVSAGPVRDPQGFVVAAVATFQDVTAHRALAEQLRQSQKMEAIGRLAGGVAHDFNNLLTIIGGYGQMVLESLKDKDPLRKDLEAILEAANRATTLTRQLLTFSRRQIVQPKNLDLNRQVSKMKRMLSRVLGEDVVLTASLKPGAARIKMDPGQIEQVLMNIAVNARDAMPRGGKLTISTAQATVSGDSPADQDLVPGAYIVLSMSDTGEGMTPEVISQIFEPFFTTKAKGKGTGLGLSTVYGIVRQNHGAIRVESVTGSGSTFHVYFPAASREESAGRRASRAEAACGGTETVLLIEDEAGVRNITVQMLRRHGYQVLEAGSGEDALTLFRDHRDAIDLVLTDVVMPQMSGGELAGRLIQLRPGLKVLFMSGYTEDVLARHNISAGAGLLQKPFTLEALGRTIRAALDAR